MKLAKKGNPDKAFSELFKTGAIMKGDDPRLDMRWLPTGIPQLDAITGGGIPYNRVVSIVGPESTGKTLLSQYIAAASQKTDRPEVLLMDFEHSFDRSWWTQSGVDMAKLMVSQPFFGEDGIDTMVAALRASDQIGCVILDSIPTMIPKIVIEADSTSDKFVGRLPDLCNRMLAVMMPLIHNIVFVHTNQMRANIGGHEEIYPGGYGLRHGTHVRLRTRRNGWIKEGNERIGYPMEISIPKNKCGIPQGECEIPFYFKGQMDLIQSYIDEATQTGIIAERLPWYQWHEEKWLGKQQMRDFFVENKGMFVLLRTEIEAREPQDESA